MSFRHRLRDLPSSSVTGDSSTLAQSIVYAQFYELRRAGVHRSGLEDAVTEV